MQAYELELVLPIWEPGKTHEAPTPTRVVCRLAPSIDVKVYQEVETAAGALQNLAADAGNQVSIAKEEGALAALVALLLRDDDGGVAAGKEKAAGALWFLAKNADNQVAIAKEEGVLAALVTMLRDGTTTGKIMAGGAVKLLSENQDAKVALLELGCDARALT